MAYQWIIKGDLDFGVDIEIDGTPVSQSGYQATLMGDNILVTPALGKRLKVYRVTYTVASNITGEVQIKINTTVKSRVMNPQLGGMYGFNLTPNFILGNINESLIINLPAAVTVDVDVCTEEV
jgi:hypothetical protein